MAEAKNKFSALFDSALTQSPQRVTRKGKGKPAIIIIAEEEYQALTGEIPSFTHFLLEDGPNLEGVDLSRDKTPMRDAKL